MIVETNTVVMLIDADLPEKVSFVEQELSVMNVTLSGGGS